MIFGGKTTYRNAKDGEVPMDVDHVSMSRNPIGEEYDIFIDHQRIDMYKLIALKILNNRW